MKEGSWTRILLGALIGIAAYMVSSYGPVENVAGPFLRGFGKSLVIIALIYALTKIMINKKKD